MEKMALRSTANWMFRLRKASWSWLIWAPARGCFLVSLDVSQNRGQPSKDRRERGQVKAAAS